MPRSSQRLWKSTILTVVLLALHSVHLSSAHPVIDASSSRITRDQGSPRFWVIERIFNTIFSRLGLAQQTNIHQQLELLVKSYDFQSEQNRHGIVGLSKDVAAILTTISSTREPLQPAQLRRIKDALQSRRSLALSTAHPGLRRVIISALLLHRHNVGKAAWVDPAVHALLDAICHKLYVLHKAGAARKVAVEFLHISKSGGTSMCKAADLNRCNTYPFERQNCKVPDFNDKPFWAVNDGGALPAASVWWVRNLEKPRVTQQDSCAHRRNTMRKQRLDFYSNEYTSHADLITDNSTGYAHMCRDFLNVALMRMPVKRMRSHVKAIIVLYQSSPRIKGVVGAKWVQRRNASSWQQLAPAAVDNLYIRSLLGESVFHLPVGALTTEHVTAARRALLIEFDVLLILEQKLLSELSLQLGLGWSRMLPHQNSHTSFAPRAVQRAIPQDFDVLERAHKLDMEVYEWGAMLQRLDMFVFSMAATKTLTNARDDDAFFATEVLQRTRERLARQDDRSRCGLINAEA